MRLLAAAFALLASPVMACSPDDPPPFSQMARVDRGDIRTAAYGGATTRYAHGVLGDAIEAGSLTIGAADRTCATVTLGQGSVFEDTGPRIADLDGDGGNEVIVVESRADTGAALAVYGLLRGALVKIDATPNIGRPNRWLAPVAIADLDGDGRTEIAYVDRPHLAKRLMVWEWRDGALALEAQMDGVTNHRIGDTGITGGLRNCGGLPEMIVLSSDWSEVQAIRWTGEGFTLRRVGPNRGPVSVTAAQGC